MADNIVLEKFLYDLLPLVMSQHSEKDAVESFAKSVKEVFGIDTFNVRRAAIIDMHGGGLYSYVTNTKKPYIDNQLSEYSEFPELIDFKNSGYASCAIMPIMVGGHTTGVLEMLSKMENRFSKDILGSLSIGAAFIGLTLGYYSESVRSKNLATYFDSAFGSHSANFLVSSSGKILKANKTAIGTFGINQTSKPDIKQVLGVDLDEIKKLQTNAPLKIVLNISGERRIFNAYYSAISQSTAYIALTDISDSELLYGISESLDGTGKIAALSLDENFGIIGSFGKLGGLTIDTKELDIRKLRLESTIPAHDYNALKSSLSEKGKAKIKTEITLGGYKEKAYLSVSKTAFGYMCIVLSAELEESVKTLSDNLMDFISVTSDITLIVDQNGIINSANLPAEQLLGYKKEQLLGRDIRSIYYEQDILDRDISYVKNGGKVDGSYVNLKKSNSELMPGTHSLRLFFDGNSYFYAIMIKELQTKRLISDIEMQNKKLESQALNFKRTSELKSQFIYNISHELKTPLTNIKGFAKLMHDGEFGAITDDQKEYINTILDEADRLMVIIMQVLDAAKLEANKVKLDLKEVNLADFANNPSIKALEESAKNKGIEFSWNVDYDVPAITADMNRLIQVFVNLIGNSIKFTESGSIKVHIYKFNRNKITCEVKDTGIGISDDDKKKLFRKFYQASKKGNVKPDGTGTGLGLAITKEIIGLHRGNIRFESEQGKGSKFWFTIPISQNFVSRKKHRDQG